MSTTAPAVPTSNDVTKICWTTVSLPPPSFETKEEKEEEQAGTTTIGKSMIQVSNSSVVLPSGLSVLTDFITKQEVHELMEQMDKGTFIWEGFERRRRVQRFSIGTNNNTTISNKDDDDDDDDDDKDSESNEVPKRQQQQQHPLPSMIQTLIDRLIQQTGLVPQHVSFEEYPENQVSKYLDTSKGTVSTFESVNRCCCSCPGGDESGDSDAVDDSSVGVGVSCRSCCSSSTTFVAQVALCVPLIEYLNRPEERRADCWNLYSPNHWTGLLLHERSLMIKSREALWEWRTRIAAVARPPTMGEEERIVLLKFSSLPDSGDSGSGGGSGGDAESSAFGYMPHRERPHIPASLAEMPPLQDLLTVVVTTSPIKSHPSTELLERTFETFLRGGPAFAYHCRKVIVCDGCRTRDESTTKKHANDKQAMRNGIVSPAQAEAYAEFKQRLRQLCAAASPTTTATMSSSVSRSEEEEPRSLPPLSPFSNSVVEELDERMGYGYALRHALHHCVATPYVIVIQHDRTFMRPTPILETVQTMWRHRNIKYVGMSMRSNLLYRDQFLGQYGRTFMEDMSQAVLRLPELALDATLYGPDSASTHQMEYTNSDKLRKNIQALAETYRASQQYTDHQDWLSSTTTTPTLPPGACQLSLTPTFYWYDNTHICETAHYRDFIFNPKYKMVARGGFIEDKVSPVIKKTVERFGLNEGHARFGCFLLDDHSGMFFTGHLDGGAYMTYDERRLITEAVAHNKLKKKNGHQNTLVQTPVDGH
jgi:hypothetical protein